jgi:molybdate transport system regulatory protein
MSGLKLRLRLTLPSGQWIGPGKADLMTGIAETGSIAAAARRMGMSYKRAWGLVEVLNGMFSAPLVAASRGGSGHGGAALTPEGHRILALFRAIEARSAAAVSVEMGQIADALPDISGQK